MENDLRPYIVYLITNLITNKWYVGKTVSGLRVRWRQHKGDARRNDPRPLYKSIRKYGIENFVIEELAIVPTLQEANQLERLWIVLLASHQREFGYNLSYGGEGEPLNEEGRKKRSERNKELGIVPPGTKGIKFHDEWKKNLSLAHLGHTPWNKGKQMSEVTKNKLSKIRTGKKHGPYKNRKGVPIKEIIRLYLEEGLSCSLIAPRYSVCGAVIRDRLIEAGVALRTLSEANTLRYQRKSTGDTAIQNQRNQQDEQY